MRYLKQALCAQGGRSETKGLLGAVVALPRVAPWCGDRDIFCPPEQSLDMYRMVQGAELAVIANADHFAMANQFGVAIVCSIWKESQEDEVRIPANG